MALSVTEAALEGFHLIGRRPVSFLAWALVWIVLGYGPLVLLFWQAWPQMAQAFGALPSVSGDAPAAIAAVMQMEFGIARVVAPWALWAWLLSTVLMAAIYRAVLEPKNRRFAYLRVGGDELRLLGLAVVYFFLSIAYVAVMVMVCVVAFLLARQLDQPWQALTDIVIVLGALVLSFWLGVRLVLAAPMTFARKRLQIFDSWRLTGGHVWSLVGLGLLMAIFLVAVSFVLAMIRNALTFGALGGMPGMMMMNMTDNPADRQAQFAHMLQQIPAMFESPFMIVALIIQGFGDMLMRVVAAAPFAEAYRELSGPSAGSAASAPGPAPQASGPEPQPHPAH